MARPNVPKWGNWDNDNNAPYTAYFDNARKNRGGKLINPNDPQENPDMFPEYASSAPKAKLKTQPEESMGQEAARQINKRRLSKEDGDFRANSPAHNENNLGGRVVNEPIHHQRHGGRGSSSGRPSREGAGSNHSIEKSPLHPHYQPKVTGRVAASPVWEGKNNSYDSSHGTHGRSFESARATPGRYPVKKESPPDRGVVVPKFGEWDENDPESAENYTEVFNKVRDERNIGSGNVPGTPSRTTYSAQRQQRNEKQKSCCCFPLW